MKTKNNLTKGMAILGSALIWFPILAPFLLGAASFLSEGRFRLDYLMPAELFPSVLVGSGLLLWAALRARARQRLIAWGLGLAIGTLFGGQGLAVVTGLASGRTQPEGWAFALVLATLVLYSLTLIGMGVGGVLLAIDLFKAPRAPVDGL